MEVEEEEEVEAAEPPRRSQRVRKQKRSDPPPRPGRRTRRDPQKMMVMRMLNAKFDAVGAGETTIKELMKFMKDQDREISKEDLLKHVRQLDEEGKVFYVADDEKLHRIA